MCALQDIRHAWQACLIVYVWPNRTRKRISNFLSPSNCFTSPACGGPLRGSLEWQVGKEVPPHAVPRPSYDGVSDDANKRPTEAVAAGGECWWHRPKHQLAHVRVCVRTVWQCTHTPALWGVATRRYGLNCNAINIDFILFTHTYHQQQN